MKYTILIAAFLFVATVGQAQSSIITRDVVYAKVNGMDLKLDIYHPDTSKVLPVVFWVHGGAWVEGDKLSASYPASALARKNIACVGVQYRLSGTAKWPAQINDCKGAIRFIKANSEKYHIDTTRIGAWGSSAGGHLVALLGTSTDQWDTKEFTVGSTKMNIEGVVGGNLNYTSKVHAVCDWFGPTDFLRMNDEQTSIDHLSEGSPESQLLGCPVLDCTEKVILANPIHYITPDDAQFLIMHGDQDNTVPHIASVILDSALRANHVTSELRTITGAGHGFSQNWLDTAAEFFQWRFYSDTTTSAIQQLDEYGITISAFPNPTNGSITITINNSRTESFYIKVIDVLGRVIEEYPLGLLPKGKHETLISLKMRSHVYYIMVEGGAQRKILPLIVR